MCTFNKIQLLALGLVMMSAPYVFSEPVVTPPVIVLTGDSITVSYEDYVSSAQSVAQSGLNAEQYMGLSGGSPVNYAQNVVDLDPDTIVFMLGANDSAPNTATAYRQYLYRTHVDSAFDLFEQSTASRIIVLSILPVDEADVTSNYGSNMGVGMNARIENNYNPWLEAEAASRTKFEYVDLNAEIQTNPNWRTEWLNADGLHLTSSSIGNTGEQWLANQVLSITAVPEPSSFLMLGFVVAAFGMIWRKYNYGS